MGGIGNKGDGLASPPRRYWVPGNPNPNPNQRLDFIRKWFDTEKGKMGNRRGLLVGILGLWVLTIVGPFDTLLMSRLLGHLEWALQPNAGAAAFMAGTYRWMQGNHICCGLPLLRSLMTAIIFAIFPQRLKPDVCPSLLGKGVEDEHVLFCDAAPSTDGANFSWVCTFQVGTTDTGGAPSGSGLCSRLNCLRLCVVFNWLPLLAGTKPSWVLTAL